MSSELTKYYIKVEAVNIYNHLADTNQLSIIRGGSLLLKQAIDDVAKQRAFKLKLISSGASQGIFETTNSHADEQIAQWLNYQDIDIKDESEKPVKNEKYRHFTFVVDKVVAEDFQSAKEKLIAKGRARQMRQLSESPDYIDTAQNLGPSELNGTRIANVETIIKKEKKLCAPLDNVRFTHGKEQRETLYREELESLHGQAPTFDFGFTYTLEYLAGDKDNKFQKKVGNLYNKIAVIYLDGNAFGKIQKEHCTDENKQREFDQHLQTLRRQFLDTLIKRYRSAKKTDDWKSLFFYYDNEQKNIDKQWQARLETLLWGGDEMCLVVPAWLGFEVLFLFYQCSAGWKFKDSKLTHAGGMVFCQATTPIFRIRQLAQELADNIKERPEGRDANYYDYLVLESVDYPTSHLTRHNRDTYGPLLAGYRSALAPLQSSKHWPNQLEDIHRCFTALPRSQFYSLVTKMLALSKAYKHQNASIEYKREYVTQYAMQLQRSEKSLCRFTEKGSLALLDQIGEQLFGSRLQLETLKSDMEAATVEQKKPEDEPAEVIIERSAKRVWCYLHLLELWDYLSPPSTPPVAESKENSPEMEGVA